MRNRQKKNHRENAYSCSFLDQFLLEENDNQRDCLAIIVSCYPVIRSVQRLELARPEVSDA